MYAARVEDASFLLPTSYVWLRQQNDYKVCKCEGYVKELNMNKDLLGLEQMRKVYENLPESNLIIKYP